jgi:cation:H+ antiporter
MVWLKLAICCAVILFAGMKLAKYGDAISERTGLGGMWIGLVLIALVTSLPEMVTGVSAAALVGQPDMALGNFWGSCIFNLTILAILDVMSRKGPVLSMADSRNILPAAMGIVLIAIASLTIIIGKSVAGLSIGWLGISSIVIFGGYLIGIRQMFIHDQKRAAPKNEEPLQYTHLSSVRIYGVFALAALAIVGGGIWLSLIGDEISITYNLSASFVGSLFLAIATSLPELVVAVTALRIGAVDLAVGDILGANMLNTANIFITDVFYSRGPLLAEVSPRNLFTAGTMIVMTLIVICGLKFKNKRKTFGFISWNTLLIVVLYLSATLFLFYY